MRRESVKRTATWGYLPPFLVSFVQYACCRNVEKHKRYWVYQNITHYSCFSWSPVVTWLSPGQRGSRHWPVPLHSLPTKMATVGVSATVHVRIPEKYQFWLQLCSVLCIDINKYLKSNLFSGSTLQYNWTPTKLEDSCFLLRRTCIGLPWSIGVQKYAFLLLRLETCQ